MSSLLRVLSNSLSDFPLTNYSAWFFRLTAAAAGWYERPSSNPVSTLGSFVCRSRATRAISSP